MQRLQKCIILISFQCVEWILNAKKCWQKFSFKKLQFKVLVWFITEVCCPDCGRVGVIKNNKIRLIWVISANIFSNYLKGFWTKISILWVHSAKLIRFLIFYPPLLGSEGDRGGGLRCYERAVPRTSRRRSWIGWGENYKKQILPKCRTSPHWKLNSEIFTNWINLNIYSRNAGIWKLHWWEKESDNFLSSWR